MFPLHKPQWLTATEIRKFGYKVGAIVLGGAILGIAINGMIELGKFIHKL